MTVYLLAHVRVTDDSWIPGYAEQMPITVESGPSPSMGMLPDLWEFRL